MSYNLWNPSEHIKESETEEGTRTKRQEEKKNPSAWVPLGKQNQLSSPSMIGSHGLHWRICCQSLGIVIVIFIFQKDKLRLRELQYLLRNMLFILGRVYLPNYKPTWLIRLFLEWGPLKSTNICLLEAWVNKDQVWSEAGWRLEGPHRNVISQAE